MSKFTHSEMKNKTFSPNFLTQRFSETSDLFEKQCEVIRKQVAELPNSPKSKEKIEKTLEEMLKSMQFFRKPDIVPYPQLRASDLKTEPNWEKKYEELLILYEKTSQSSKELLKENSSLKEQLSYYLDFESKYRESLKQSFKTSDMSLEVDKLNTRIKILLDENDELRRKLRFFDSSFNPNKSADLDIERQQNLLLNRKLLHLQEAYEDLRNAYVNDIEKLKPETRREKLEKNDESMTERIRTIKNEYKEKLKKLENRVETDRTIDLPDSKLREIENKLINLQEKIELTSRKDYKNSKPTTPYKARQSPRRTKRVLNPVQKSKNSTPSRSPFRTDESTSKLAHSFSCRSPLNPAHSPSRPCQTCIKRHGNCWANSRN